MAPHKSPQKKNSKKGKGSRKSVLAVVETPKSVQSPSKAKGKSSSKSSAKYPKKSSKKSLIKNPKFKKAIPSMSSGSAAREEAPWFSSLVHDVASVLNKEGSPLKRKLADNTSGSNKKQKSNLDSSDVDVVDNGSEHESGNDSDFDLGDEDYYYDQFDDILDDGNTTNNANSGGFLNSQKRELLDFMESFISAYDNRGHCASSGPGKSAKTLHDVSSNNNPRKTLRFPPESARTNASNPKDESLKLPVPFGSQFLDASSSVCPPSHDKSFVQSLKQDRQANKVTETFLQLAGLSQSESSDLFRKANAKKSGEHRKPSDSSPVEIRLPQEMLERPRGSETGYNDLSVTKFLSGNLAIIEAGLPDSKYYALIRAQLGYFRTLCDDISDYNWALVREAHKAVLLSIEKGALDPNDLGLDIEWYECVLRINFEAVKV